MKKFLLFLVAFIFMLNLVSAAYITNSKNYYSSFEDYFTRVNNFSMGKDYTQANSSEGNISIHNNTLWMEDWTSGGTAYVSRNISINGLSVNITNVEFDYMPSQEKSTYFDFRLSGAYTQYAGATPQVRITKFRGNASLYSINSAGKLIFITNIGNSTWTNINITDINFTSYNYSIYVNGTLFNNNVSFNYNTYSVINEASFMAVGTQISYNYIDNLTINYELHPPLIGFYNASYSYNNESYEGQSETFYLNVSYNSTHWTSASAYLIYNSTTRTTVSSTGSGGNIYFKDSVTAPHVTSTKNIPFKWVLTLSNSTNTTSIDIDDYANQTVFNVTADNCAAGSFKILNITLQDEETRAYFNSSYKAYNASIEIDLGLYYSGSSTAFFNYTAKFNYTNNVTVCINRNLSASYVTYAQIKYYADSYTTEYYYLQNQSIGDTKIPINITLHDLLTVDSTTFLTTYKDENYLGVDNALLVLKRKYVSDGVYRTVEIAVTDENGQGVLHLDTGGVAYSIDVYKEGTLLSSFDNVVVYCEDSVIGDCKINLYASASVTKAEDFYTKDNMGYSLLFNQTTKLVKLSYTILDGSVSVVSLNISKLDPYRNVTLCASKVSGSSGSITCDVNSTYGNVTFIVELWKDNHLITTEIYSIIPDTSDIFGDNAVILILVQFLSLAFLLIPSAIGVILSLGVGLVISAVLFYISPSLFATSGVGWLIVALVLIIIKLHNRGSI